MGRGEGGISARPETPGDGEEGRPVCTLWFMLPPVSCCHRYHLPSHSNYSAHVWSLSRGPAA